MIRPGFLSSADRIELEDFVRRQREDHGIARRANAILLLDDGESCALIAKFLYLDDDIIRGWHKTYMQDGLISLTDQELWALGGACIGQNARMRAGRAAKSHHPRPGSPFFSAVDRPVLPLSFSFCQDRGHAHDGGARRRWIVVRMALTITSVTATSASWKVMARA
jgi:hypothetical protein